MFVLDDAIAAAVVDTVVAFLFARGLQFLSGDPQKRAFKAALSEAVRDFDREHGDWSASFFDQRLLTTAAAPILAGVLLRDPQPGAAALAAAWANQFPAGTGPGSQRLNEAVSIAAEFLVIFDLALRRQDAFRAHFDSQAMDSTARYLSELLRYARASWIEARQDKVTEALEMLAGSVLRYQEAARSQRRASDQVVAAMILDAKIARQTADLRLSRLQYSDTERLRILFKQLIDEPYSAATFGSRQVGVAFDEGIEEYLRALYTAPPL